MTILDAQDEKSAFGELPAAVLHASETCGDSFVHVTQESVYLPRLPFTESVLPCWHAAKATSMLNDHASTISHAGDVAGRVPSAIAPLRTWASCRRPLNAHQYKQ